MSFVSSNLAYIRRTLGYSQAQLAEELGIKRSLLGAYEEARATPRYDVLERISTLSGHSVSDLLNKALVPEGYQAPAKRGRAAGGVAKPAAATPSGGYSAPSYAPEPKVQPAQADSSRNFPATLTLTVDTAGQPQVSLVGHEQLGRYGSLSHSASYVAAMPTLSLPMLEEGQPYRAFEVLPGQVHICRLVRNWGGIQPGAATQYVIAYRSRVMLGVPYSAGRGLEWEPSDNSLQSSTQRAEEPLEIWQSEWVLTRHWQPLPAQLDAIVERLAALEAKLG